MNADQLAEVRYRSPEPVEFRDDYPARLTYRKRCEPRNGGALVSIPVTGRTGLSS